jgi:hypothetical protein
MSSNEASGRYDVTKDTTSVKALVNASAALVASRSSRDGGASGKASNQDSVSLVIL